MRDIVNIEKDTAFELQTPSINNNGVRAYVRTVMCPYEQSLKVQN